MTTQSSPGRCVVRDGVGDRYVGGEGGVVGGEGGRVNSDFRQHKPVSGLSTEAENEVEAENKVQAENEPTIQLNQTKLNWAVTQLKSNLEAENELKMKLKLKT